VPIAIGVVAVAASAAAIAFSARGSRSAATGGPIPPFAAHPEPIATSRIGRGAPAIALAPDGRSFLETTPTGVFLAARTGGAKTAVKLPFKDIRVTWSSGMAGWLVVEAADGELCTWWHVPMDGHAPPVRIMQSWCYTGLQRMLDVSPDGRTAAFASGDHVVLRDLRTGTDRPVRQTSREWVVVGFSPDGSRLAISDFRTGFEVIDVATGATIADKLLVVSSAWIDRDHLLCAESSSNYIGMNLRILDLRAPGAFGDGPPLATLDGQVGAIEIGTDGVLLSSSATVRAAYTTSVDATAPRQLSELAPIDTGSAELMLTSGWTERDEPILAVIDGGQRSFVRVTAEHRVEALAHPAGPIGGRSMSGPFLPYWLREDPHTVAGHFLDTSTGVDRVWKRVPLGQGPKLECARAAPVCLLIEGRYATQRLDPRTGELGPRIHVDLGSDVSVVPTSVSFDGSEIAVPNEDATAVELIRLADGHVTTIKPPSTIELTLNNALELTASGDLLVVSTHDEASTLYRMSRDGGTHPLVVAPYHSLSDTAVSPHGQVLFTASESRETISFLPFQ
jgi:hypothetical protein